VKFLLELASEEIPARMQAAAVEQLRARFVDGCKAAGLGHGAVTADVTPRRLWLIADDVAPASAATREERKGPAATAPEAAIAGFLRSTGVPREQLEERQTPKGVVLFAHIDTPGRDAAAILAELVPAIVTGFQWPKSMRWGAASAQAGSPRWVRPLTGIVALLDGKVVACEAHGITAGRVTRGHRIHAPGDMDIAGADSYLLQLRGARVIASSAERRAIIETNAATVALTHGLSVIPDAGLVAENAGLTEWPVPMLGHFDPAFLSVPREVIQLTMRTNQKYFALADSTGALAPAFVCVANLLAKDGGTAIIAGNERVLSARLADAKFFWDQDVATVKAGGLEAFLPKLADIVFHEKLGTVADKVERVAKLARWLVESGAVKGDADLAEQAARLCKADLVSATVGEFPEVQGIAGAYLARVAGLDAQVADAIRDHYKPVGQGDEVPAAPVSIAVALADKLDNVIALFAAGERPSGSRDPLAIRRSALGALAILSTAAVRFSLEQAISEITILLDNQTRVDENHPIFEQAIIGIERLRPELSVHEIANLRQRLSAAIRSKETGFAAEEIFSELFEAVYVDVPNFLVDRLKVQQREAGVPHDLIDAVFALGGEDDLVRLLARVKALQRFVGTDDGANLLSAYRRAAGILKAEEAKDGRSFASEIDDARFIENSEHALNAASTLAIATARAAIQNEDFDWAMEALSHLRPAIDGFFKSVMVNDPDSIVRAGRLALLARFRDAVHQVADFSKVEG
jgi:glycyl-tRNA synthetase beta chain